MNRQLVVAGVLATGAGTVATILLHAALRVPWHWSVLLAAAAAAVLGLGVAFPVGGDLVWAPLPAPDGPPGTHQVATLTSRLGEAHRDPRRFVVRIQPRLAAVAAARLRSRYGFGLDDPRACAVLGTDLYRLLTDPAATLPDSGAAAMLLDRLEKLDRLEDR